MPFTDGDRRTWFDGILYFALLISVAVPLLSSGVHSESLSQALPHNTSGLVDPTLLIAPIVLLVLNGLRDKIVFLAARGEQYLPALFFFTVLPFVDMIIALKLLIVVVWVGAGVSKFGKHFANVIPPMVSNSPCMPFKWVKRAHYRDFPRDLRPSRAAHFMAHVLGTTVEIAAPLVLLFSTNKSLTVAAVVVMVAFHLFIISTFPLAVPLEWNVLFAYATIFLFLGFPAWHGYAVSNMSSPWLTASIVAALVFFPILGNFRPDKVSFLPSMRQYAGNWASAVWAFAPGAEAKLNKVTRTARNQIDQFIAFGYEPQWAEITLQRAIAWRTMHSQGRGLFSVLLRTLPDVDARTVREAEFVCNSLIGFNFGDGHLHNEDLIAAVQRQAAFEPGELVVVWVESQAWGSKVQHYKVIDAALGVIERGTWKVSDAVKEQPWLPNGPIPTHVTWSLAGKREPSTPVPCSRMSTATVVGAGPNGLAAAVTLAKAGVDVTVLEAADEIGGGTRTSEAILPGLLHDHCSAIHPMAVGSPFLAGLGLERYGLTWRLPEIDCVHPLDDGRAGVLYRSVEATADGLGIDHWRWRGLFSRTSNGSTRYPTTSWGRC